VNERGSRHESVEPDAALGGGDFPNDSLQRTLRTLASTWGIEAQDWHMKISVKESFGGQNRNVQQRQWRIALVIDGIAPCGGIVLEKDYPLTHLQYATGTRQQPRTRTRWCRRAEI
jgi:hypothetical protein